MVKKYIEYGDLLGKPKDPDFKQIGKVKTESVFKFTKKHWKEWVELLNKAGASTWTHQEITALLKKKYKLTPWWQQWVAIGYQQAIGRREPGQDSKGTYMVTATKSLACTVGKVWKLLTSEKGQEVWLKPLSVISIKAGAQFETSDGFFGEIRTLKKNRRLRMTWQDPNWEKKTTLEIMMVPKPKEKSILVFNHAGIKDAKSQEQLRKRWKPIADQILKLTELL